MKKFCFIIIILTSCSVTNNLKSIQKNVVLTEKNLESFTKYNIFDFELDNDESINLAAYKSKNELKKIHFESTELAKTTIIYFKKGEPILIIEDIRLPTEYSFPTPSENAKNKHPVIELNRSSKYRIYINDWEKYSIEVIQEEGIKPDEKDFSKDYYQNLINKVQIRTKK